MALITSNSCFKMALMTPHSPRSKNGLSSNAMALITQVLGAGGSGGSLRCGTRTYDAARCASASGSGPSSTGSPCSETAVCTASMFTAVFTLAGAGFGAASATEGEQLLAGQLCVSCVRSQFEEIILHTIVCLGWMRTAHDKRICCSRNKSQEARLPRWTRLWTRLCLTRSTI